MLIGGVSGEIEIGRKSFSIESVCDLVAGYEDKLPQLVFEKLRSFMHNRPDDELIARIEANPSYAHWRLVS